MATSCRKIKMRLLSMAFLVRTVRLQLISVSVVILEHSARHATKEHTNMTSHTQFANHVTISLKMLSTSG